MAGELAALEACRDGVKAELDRVQRGAQKAAQEREAFAATKKVPASKSKSET